LQEAVARFSYIAQPPLPQPPLQPRARVHPVTARGWRGNITDKSIVNSCRYGNVSKKRSLKAGGSLLGMA
jgi:hypothetical protein